MSYEEIDGVTRLSASDPVNTGDAVEGLDPLLSEAKTHSDRFA